VELYQRIEQLLGKKLPLYPTEEEEVMLLGDRVAEAQRTAKLEQKDMEEKKGGGGKRKRGNQQDIDDSEQSLGVRKRMQKGNQRGAPKGNQRGGQKGNQRNRK
jgi:ATP-dependent RNA helicase DDX47/RRP3